MITKCNLQLLLDYKNWTLEEAAEAIGDDPKRLLRVQKGLEPMGRTALLAALAVKNDLPPIVCDRHDTSGGSHSWGCNAPECLSNPLASILHRVPSSGILPGVSSQAPLEFDHYAHQVVVVRW